MLYDSEAFLNVFNALEPSVPASLQLFKFISSSVKHFMFVFTLFLFGNSSITCFYMKMKLL